MTRRRAVAGGASLLLALGGLACGGSSHAGRHGAQASLSVRNGSGCHGEPLPPKPGGGIWRCSFDDEFDSSTADATALNSSRWSPQLSATTGYTTGRYPYTACYVNSPNNISVSGGALHLTVREEPAPFLCGRVPMRYTAGMVTTVGHFSQTYGRFEVRAQLPVQTAAGLQETLWLFPVDTRRYGSGSGEVDFSEFYSDFPTLDIPRIHYDYDRRDSTTNTNVVTNYCPIEPSHYNDYAVIWEPGSFQISVNGETCLIDHYEPDDAASPAPFDKPFFVALTQALGVSPNAFNPATTSLPATTNIKYVRVWK